MNKSNSMKMIPAMILVAFSGAAGASGFQLAEQNGSGLGNAYAGSAAVADNASTIYFNPAGMTQLQGLIAGAVLLLRAVQQSQFRAHRAAQCRNTTQLLVRFRFL